MDVQRSSLEAVQLIGELAEATGRGTSMRGLARAIGRVFATHGATRVELRDVSLVLRAGEWVFEHTAHRHATDEPPVTSAFAAATMAIAPGIAIGFASQSALVGWFEEPAFREAVARVIDAAIAHVEALRRVAAVSRNAHAVNRELREEADRKTEHGTLVARSEAMRAVANRIELVAKHPTTVLLLGESGTGKEVVAREIHRRSPRAQRPLIQLNCAAIPEALVEAELFGCERGAFTGADRARAGAFERAHRGTLLLDEIGELPLAAQAKLLRVVQERKVQRVGGQEEIEVDVRVIAATNRSLPAMVSAKTFREDLYYRLDVFSIALPALRDRREDFAPLVANLLAQLAAKLDVPIPAITDAELGRLAAHAWPGNVRELMNVLETALILGGQLPAFAPSRPDRDLNSAVRAAIEDALAQTRGKLYGADGAAARLGLPPATLQSKMKKLGIARSRFATPTYGSTTRR